MKPELTAALPPPPIHRREASIVEKHGMCRIDPYAWMKPADWPSILRTPQSLSGDIKDAVDKENAYTDAFLSASGALMRELSAEVAAIKSLSDTESGVVRGGDFYFERKSPDGEIVFGRRSLKTGAEQILLDMGLERASNAQAKLSWGGPRISADQSLFGWAVDSAGSGIFAVKVRHLESDALVVDDVHDCHGGFAFDKTGQHLFWVGRDDKGRPANVWRRDIDDGSDVRCFENLDPSYFIDLKSSASGEFIFIRLLNGDQSEVWFIPSEAPGSAPAIVEPMSAFHDYDVEHWRGEFVIRTNADGADDYKIVSAPTAAPGRANWKVIVPHLSGRNITGLTPFSEYLVRSEWRDAKPRLVIMDPDGGEDDVEFDDAAYCISVTPNQQYDSEFISYSFSSPVSPPRLIKTALSSAKSAPLLESGAAHSFDETEYMVKRLNILSADGAAIPVTLLSKKTSPPSSGQPLYLYAYGAYGDVTEASFRPDAVALVDRGWTYAIAHVRGGGERGTSWWRPTLKQGKKTTFADFTTCAEALISMGLAREGNIVAHGMSAGGLLMGSVFTTHPHLWAGVIAQVPFVDVLNTLDDWRNHPLGSTPFAIWGDPRIEEDYRYMAGYSPYDQLRPAAYPNLLTTGGVADDRVAFWEPLKFVAQARHLNTGSASFFSRIGPEAGHLGDPSPEGQLFQSALFLAFALCAVEG